MYAIEKITDIRARGKTPFLVGGTGLYIDSVLYDYQFPPPVPREIRQQYDTWSLETLQHYCDDNNIDLPENSQNKRYIINAIVRAGQKLEKRTLPLENTIVVGIATDKITLRQRIEQRAEAIITPAVMDEARRVADDYGWDNEAMTGNIYPLLRRHLADELSFSDMKQAFVTLDWRLAKRQLTWLRRNEHIVWLGLDEAYTYCARALAKLNNS
jgi:tRNA dimethylallyltransferase